MTWQQAATVDQPANVISQLPIERRARAVFELDGSEINQCVFSVADWLAQEWWKSAQAIMDECASPLTTSTPSAKDYRSSSNG